MERLLSMYSTESLFLSDSEGASDLSCYTERRSPQFTGAQGLRASDNRGQGEGCTRMCEGGTGEEDGVCE